MDILIQDAWLREFLKTDATNKEIAKYLSLCGPSIEKTIKTEYGDVYAVEVTTNRMDTACIYGIAREALAILPRFKKKAVLKLQNTNSNYKFVSKVSYLKTDIDPKLCPRFTAVLIKNVKLAESPQVVKERLTASNIRPINNVVDISNYIMLELGQPVHTFDYDKIQNHLMVLRESQREERITTLDNATYTLPGGDIVIEDASEKLIDLCGIMGGKSSAVDENSKNILLFVQNYNPAKIRKTSMILAKRSQASSLFEKGIDSEQVKIAILRAVNMFIKLTKGTPEKEILDIYPSPYKKNVIKLNLEQIVSKLGIDISKNDISNILFPLGFKSSWQQNLLKVEVPSLRAGDINIPEDIIEEIARIYGYHNLPSEIMTGKIPDKPNESGFAFEDRVKDILKGYGGCEIYTLSLVSKENTQENSLELKNPLGEEYKYLRTSLIYSLKEAAKDNLKGDAPFHLFEIANVYIPKSEDLPDEKMTLAGVFANTDFRKAKGIVESLLSELNINADFIQEELKAFIPGQRISIKVDAKDIGQFGNLEGGDFIYYEFDIQTLYKLSKNIKKYVPISLYPPQIEDITLTFPEKTKIGEVVKQIRKTDKLIDLVELKDTYKDSFTFRICYRDPNKNLTDEEVCKIRIKIIGSVKSKFGGVIKD